MINTERTSLPRSLALAFCTLLFGCGQASDETTDQGDSETSAFVSSEQARKAFDVVYRIDYLPFNYIKDGCYARELYMSMELASFNIPSSAHYIYGSLRPNAQVAWSYHVAPLLKVDESEPWVLDPAFERKPLKLSSWIGKNFPAGQYTTETKAGSAYFDFAGRTSQFNKSRMIKNFDEMPAFLTNDIASACSVMYNYIARESGDIQYKRIKLLNRTTELVHDLKKRKKLEIRTLSTRYNARCRQAISAGSL